MNKRNATNRDLQTWQVQDAAAHPEARACSSLEELLLGDDARTDDLVPVRRKPKLRQPVDFG